MNRTCVIVGVILTSLTLAACGSSMESEKSRISTDETTEVFWSPRNTEGHLLFAKLLLAVEAPVVSLRHWQAGNAPTVAVCQATVLRPGMDTDHRLLVTASNTAVCALEDAAGHKGQVSLDLGGEAIYAWGNRFFPKGFSVKNELATTLFTAFEKLHGNEAANPYLIFRDTSFPSPGFVLDFVDYSIDLNPAGADGRVAGPTTMSCVKEYFYAPGHVRPPAPDYVRCDFIYQFTRSDRGGAF